MRKICLYFVKVTIKTFRHVHPDRRWKAYEWKINFAQLLDEILTVFNNILSHIEVSKFEILFKPEIISKHHHTCFYIFLILINFSDIEFSPIAFSQNRVM